MRLTLILLVAATACAQSGPNVITINASRNVTVVPDQVDYSVTVQTGASGTVEDALGRLGGTGITAENLTYVSSALNSVSWTFDLIVPFTRMQEVGAVLRRLSQPQGPSRGPSSSAVQFSVGSRTSTDAGTQACQYPALMSDARRAAERLAAAAGVHAGQIVAISDQPDPTITYSAVFAVYDPFGSVIPSTISGVLTGVFTSPQPQNSTCSLTVQFALVP